MITDDELRDLFSRRAENVPTTHEIPSALQRRVRRRQRTLAFATVAAVVVFAVGAWLSVALLSQSDEPQGEKDHETVGLLPPTPDTLAGIWAEVQGPGFQPVGFLIRFSRDGEAVFRTTSISNFSGYPTEYAVKGNTIRFRTTAELTPCPVGDTWTFRADLSQDGRLDIEVIEGGNGQCPRVGEEWTMVRVSPRSAAGALIVADEVAGEAAPLPAQGLTGSKGLTGIWHHDGQLLSLNEDMSYAMDDGGELDTSPDEEGDYRLKGRTLTFTGETATSSCPRGAVKVWKQLRLDGETLRGVVHKDECADSVGNRQAWKRISDPPLPGNED